MQPVELVKSWLRGILEIDWHVLLPTLHSQSVYFLHVTKGPLAAAVPAEKQI